jgi:molybdenum cofactor synthesis domain-containing protein
MCLWRAALLGGQSRRAACNWLTMAWYATQQQRPLHLRAANPRRPHAPEGRRALAGAADGDLRGYGGPKLSASKNKAGILIIGDEILAGKVVDSNASWLSQLLHLRGVDVCRVETVGDCLEEIQESVLRIKAKVGDGPVFTSGGIGPTHDDVTYRAIALAFGRSLKVHPETLERMTKHYAKKNQEVNDMRKRMATLPENCDVLFTEGMWVPLAVVEGVHILPGIPRLFQAMVEAHQEVRGGGN